MENLQEKIELKLTKDTARDMIDSLYHIMQISKSEVKAKHYKNINALKNSLLMKLTKNQPL